MARTGQDSPNWTLLLSNHSPVLECSGLRDSGGSWKGKLLRLEWKVITAGWLTVPKREKSGQTWVKWSVILANQPCAQTSNSQHLALRALS